MGVYNPTHILIAPGTLYAAPLGTAEPTAVTGAWPTGWVELGYTDQGSTFTFTPTMAAVEVEEEYWPIKNVVTAYAAKLTFVLAEPTRQNLVLLLNGGIGTGVNPTMEGGSGLGAAAYWAEPPAPGQEERVMLGWDALPEGATTGTNPAGRLIARKCLQTGAIKMMHRKGNNKTTYSAEFSLEKPVTKQPFRMLFEPIFVS